LNLQTVGRKYETRFIRDSEYPGAYGKRLNIGYFPLTMLMMRAPQQDKINNDVGQKHSDCIINYQFSFIDDDNDGVKFDLAGKLL
jgi:hypothetical protein